MDGTSGDQEFLSDFRVANPPGNLELHLALQHEDQFIGRMREILPALSWRVDPEITAETPLRPFRSDLFTVDDCHPRSPHRLLASSSLLSTNSNNAAKGLTPSVPRPSETRTT
jgi:hypothetical protein